MRYRESDIGLKDKDLRRLAQDLCNVAAEERVDITAAATPATAFTVEHHMRRIPTGVIQHVGTNAGVVYADATDRAAWSEKQITLKCSVASWAGKIDLY